MSVPGGGVGPMSGVEDGEVVDPMSQCIMGNCHMEKPPPQLLCGRLLPQTLNVNVLSSVTGP